jgi:hypothetical protein
LAAFIAGIVIFEKSEIMKILKARKFDAES